jgi:hypothetical protein
MKVAAEEYQGSCQPNKNGGSYDSSTEREKHSPADKCQYFKRNWLAITEPYISVEN